jgi:hypothetical protein
MSVPHDCFPTRVLAYVKRADNTIASVGTRIACSQRAHNFTREGLASAHPAWSHTTGAHQRG